MKIDMFDKVINFYRIGEWYYHLGFVYLGMVYASKSYIISSPKMIIGILAASLYLAGGYSYNKFSDSQDMKKNLIPLIILGTFIIWSLYLIKFAVVFYLLAIVLNIFYSNPKYLWKRYHLFSVLLNGYTFGLLFLLGVLVISLKLSAGVYLLTIFFMMAMFPYQIVHEISHFSEDNKYDDKRFISYIKQIYYLLFILLLYAIFIYVVLKMDILFVIITFLFIACFFICVLKIGGDRLLNIAYAKRIRLILRCIGITYGLLLLPVLVK